MKRQPGDEKIEGVDGTYVSVLLERGAMNNHLPVDITPARHYTRGEGCDSWVLTEGENLSVKQEKMPPATRECLHFHERAGQFFYILQGRAEFTLHESAQGPGSGSTAGRDVPCYPARGGFVLAHVLCP